jgi:hypothetical protein
MQHGEVSCAKRARPLSQNEIREIVMDSDSDEGEYCAPDTEEEEEPRPPLRRSSSSKPPLSPHFSASSPEDEDDVGNVAGQQPQPCQWGLSRNPPRHVVHTFTGAPNGKSIAAPPVTRESTPFSVLLLFFGEIITLLVVETNRYYQHLVDNSGDGPSPQCDVTEAEMFAF